MRCHTGILACVGGNSRVLEHSTAGILHRVTGRDNSLTGTTPEVRPSNSRAGFPDLCPIKLNFGSYEPPRMVTIVDASPVTQPFHCNLKKSL